MRPRWRLARETSRGRDLDVPALTATTSSGSIEIYGEAGEASLETGSGDIRALDLTASALTAIASSGSIEVEGVAGETSLETGSGDIRSESLSTSALTANTSSGSVILASTECAEPGGGVHRIG